MRLLALLVLLPFVAHADEVVTRKDGSQVLLKEDGSWTPLSGTLLQPEPDVIIVQPAAGAVDPAAGAVDPAESGCQASETYPVVDEKYRNLEVQLGKMAAAKTEICLDGYIQVWWADEETARILYTRPTQEQQEDFRVADLLEEPMVVALPSAHELAGGDRRGEPLPLRALAEETFIVYGRTSGPGLLDATMAACLRVGFSPRLGQEAPRITSTLGLVSAGLGVALVPASMQRVRVDGVAYRRLMPAERPTALLNLVLRRGDPSAVVRNFSDLVRRAAHRTQGTEETAD